VFCTFMSVRVSEKVLAPTCRVQSISATAPREMAQWVWCTQSNEPKQKCNAFLKLLTEAFRLKTHKSSFLVGALLRTPLEEFKALPISIAVSE